MHSEQRFNHYATIGMPSVLRFEYEWYMSIFFIAGHLVVPDVLQRQDIIFMSPSFHEASFVLKSFKRINVDSMN